MKKAIILVAISFIGLSTFAQAKKQAEVKREDSVQASPQRFALLLSQEEWDQLVSVVGSSGKLTGDKISDYLQYLLYRRIALPTPADSSKPKK